ncbi:carboxylesterase/lipase family protein [Sphingomonas pokkalii]|uniref:Carboxylic ester hydrolase n=1 Tax=Sphingomonas pokkalii TaxID=2175090 RepID=A0A2U0SH85_9SPHN|nr:carboxylesterase family protein [Sphingomonas pokkalii]PVX30720.1 carboxylesterase [Sphingomonas pokkalii]
MKAWMTALACGVAACAIPVAAAAQTGSAVVTTQTGKVQGAVEDGVASWKGIPFAAPPVGPLRWRAPQPIAAWNAVRPALQYSSDCMQKPFPSDAAPLGTTPAEDCLYLNIWKPASTAAGTKLPVMIWIYGGGFVNGGASPPTYAGANMAKQGILFVSFNYRVGRFGSFALPQLTRENPDGGLLANYGFMDQIAALKWVQKNIAAFGGDPANVTIIGESAGGMSVHTLVTSPLSRGLFHKAVVMSGGNAQTARNGTLRDAEAIGENLARAHGIDPAAPDALAKLRALGAEQVTDGLSMMELFAPKPGPRTYGGPVVDGKLLVDQEKAYASGDFAKVPMLIGATSADMGGKSGFMIAGAREASAMVASQKVPVWEYRFSYVADSVGQPGAGHATEIPFFFDNARIKYGAATTAKDEQMGKTVSAYLVNFAKAGDPNGGGLPAWPRFTAAGDEILDFGADGKAVAGRDPWGSEIDDIQTRTKAALASGHYNSLTTPIGTMLDDPAARAILMRHAPDVTGNPRIDMARGQTLAGIQAYFPAQLTDAKLQAIDTDLAQIPGKKQ